VIELVDDLLRRFLRARLPTLLPTDDHVRFEPPNHTFPPLVGHVEGHVASVYLIDVRENRRLRSNERHLDPLTYEWELPPHRVDCHYLITAWSNATPAGGIDPTIEEHKVLSRVAAALLEEGDLSFARVLPAATLAGLPEAVREADLPITVGPGEGFNKMAEFWGTMGATAPWRPAVYLIVTVPLPHVTDLEPGPPVETIHVTVAAIGADAAELTCDIGGTIETAGGLPIPGAWVALETPVGLRLDEQHATEDGRYVFAGRPPGDYRVAVRADGFAPPPTTPIHVVAPAIDGYRIVVP
jgi:hypothetical protein